MEFRDIIRKLTDKKDLSQEEAKFVMNEIMTGKMTNAQIASLLTALKMKGESVEEITTFAKVMREKAETIHPNADLLVDTCGTGGDASNSFNISTVTAFVVAGAGIAVAKHGNRSVSSSCGSADVLESLGVNLNLKPKEIEKLIEKIGIGFLFAPTFHPAMKYALPVRKEMGMKTVFNILGPLTNPANTQVQIMGVYDPNLTETLVNVLKNLGLKSAMVVHGSGLDEITTTGETKISEFNNGEIKTYEIKPEDFGFKRVPLKELQTSSIEENTSILLDILKGKKGLHRDIVLMNAAATIYIAGKASSIEEGIKLAEKSIDSESAYQKLQDLIKYSKGAM